jgi:dTDP-glucose 4,6-dehydratase
MDHSLAGRELGFAPEYDFARGIGRTLAWYADNQPWVEAIQSGEYRRFMDAWYKDRS